MSTNSAKQNCHSALLNAAAAARVGVLSCLAACEASYDVYGSSKLAWHGVANVTKCTCHLPLGLAAWPG